MIACSIRNHVWFITSVGLRIRLHLAPMMPSSFLQYCFSSPDDFAVSALTKYYEEHFKDGEDVLDICSSWVSHFPTDFKGGNVVGLGMNDYELSQNKQINDYVVKDLNEDPVLPFDDESFDKVCCVVSVDYLNKPLQIFKEIGRVLRPGGECILSMSNRW